MSAVEQTLRANGANKIKLLVESGNQQAEAFYLAARYSDQPLKFFSKVFGP